MTNVNYFRDKKRPPKRFSALKRSLFLSVSDRPGNLAGTQAAGAGVDIFRGTVYNRLDSLHIRLPGTVGTPVGMGNLDTEGHPFSAAITLCHLLHLLFSSRYNIIPNGGQKCKGFGQKIAKNPRAGAVPRRIPLSILRRTDII